MTEPVRLAVIGAGLIGKRHVEHITIEASAELFAIVDPSDNSRIMAAEYGVKWFPTFAEMAAAGKPDGVVISTPNQVHVLNGLEAIAGGVPALVEKPIAVDVPEAQKLVDAADKAGIPLLVGHHRRHNPMIQKAKETIDAGRLGKIVSVHAMCWFFKPDDYFDVEWRRNKGAGPVFLNLIHDVDLLRYLCGDVVSVQAQESSDNRFYEVEDTAVILLRFKSGVLGTINSSDTIVAPWSWEITTGENPTYPRTDESCYFIGGTHGSLTVPYLDLWHNKARRSWSEPIHRDRVPFQDQDPLTLQIRQFANVIRGKEPPLVSGREGLQTLKVIEAVKQAAATGMAINV
ncbi:MAG: Gfo/Idh/MocA family oxidoreductase [Rhodopila sp.]|jgi:predicted dehydrogenase